MVDFNFFLNRQGVRGNKGEQGEQGYSPRITVKTETASEYVLNVQNEDGSFDTPNLRGNAIENLGGTYVRFNQNTEQMYTGYADTASTTSQGEVTLSTYEDLASGGDESEVTTSKDVHDFVEAKISEASVNYVDIDDYTQKMGELDSAISDLDENKLDFTGLANTLNAGTNITITPNTSTGKITIAGEPVSQAQADWNQTDTNAPDYIKNKPTIPEAVTIDSELSSTSTNPVQNRLITNAINLISNEFENYATNKLDNLSNEGEVRLHALKAYSDNGEVLTDAKGLSDITKYAHSTFDLSKFTVVGSPTITDDGVASGFSLNDYITVPDTFQFSSANNWEIYVKFRITDLTVSPQIIFDLHQSNSLTPIRLMYNNFNNQHDMRIGLQNQNGNIINLGTTTLVNNISENEWYTYRIKFTGTEYIISSFVNGNWEVLLSKASTEKIADGQYFKFGLRGAAAQPLSKGSIDLKQFSITVDGVEVFSGNKTGIDTIKPDNYTVVGTPTISADGVASGLGSYNYIYVNNFSCPNRFVFKGKFKPTTTTLTQRLFNISGSPDHPPLGLMCVAGRRYQLFITSDNTNIASYYDSTDYCITLNVLNYYKFSYDGSVYKLETSTDDKNYTTVATITSSEAPKNTAGKLAIGSLVSNMAYEVFEGSIDLNSFKIYVDGNLVYQPCLKIPYTESKTGSKVVDSVYRSRVNDMASQFGSANYYTLDEDNGNFTLPQVELYGLIEKAASTVPSGVVQSSTINNIVSLTQAEYDALTTKDSNTFYVITPSI